MRVGSSSRAKRHIRLVAAALLICGALAVATPLKALPSTGLPISLPVSPPPVAAPAGPNAKGDGKFHVRGADIIGPNGGKFIPRGINFGGLEQTPTGYDIGYWNFKRMKDWGANFVRVAISDTFWLKTMCTYDAGYAGRVDQIVQWGEKLKLLVLLDDHNGTKGQSCGTGKWANLQKSPDVHNLNFVKQLATRYKNHPYVAIDLYNEPHDIPEPIWRNGGIVDGYRGVGMQQLLDTVRSTGFKHLAFATGNDWGNDLRMIVNNPLISDGNVVYAAHAYPYWCDNRYYPPERPYERCYGHLYPPHLDSKIPQLIGKKPVVLAEFGTYRPIAGEMAEPIDWAERHGIGWSAWLWCNGSARNYCLLDPAGGNKPSIIGQPVRDALRRATGR